MKSYAHRACSIASRGTLLVVAIMLLGCARQPGEPRLAAEADSIMTDQDPRSAATPSLMDADLGVTALANAARQGVSDAQYQLARRYHEGDGVEQDLAAARTWYRIAANAGDARANLALGDLYLASDRILHAKRAAQRYMAAAEAGSLEAQCTIGHLYAIGMGVRRDIELARGWLEIAAERGHIEARTSLGVLYMVDDLLPRDLDAAREWLRPAAEVGHPRAQLALGDTFAAVGNDATAATWYRKAALQHHPIAQLRLATVYMNGQGVPRDEIRAHAWFTMAAERGDADAARQRDLAESQLSTTDLAASREFQIIWSGTEADATLITVVDPE